MTNCNKVIATKAMEMYMLWLKSWSPSGKKAAIVYGPTGVGKTTTIYCVSRRLGYEVVTYDYENNPGFEVILSRARARGWQKVVLHLDRPFEEMRLKGKQLAKIIRESVNPVVIETVRPEMYRWVLGAEIEVRPPPKQKIAQLLREQALAKPNYKLVSSDVRQALLLGYGSETYETRDWSRDLLNCLKNRECSAITDSHVPAALDTVVHYCYGFECVEAITLLVAADLSKRFEQVLSELELSRTITRTEIYYYKKLKAAKESEASSRK